MKTNANNKISVEEALNALSLPQPDEHDLESAQKRVWNQLSHSISKLEKVEHVEVIKEERVTRSLPNRAFRFVLTFVLVLMLIGGGSGLFWYIGYSLGNNGGNVVVDPNGTNNTVNVKALAASRFSELNGVTFEEFTSAIDSVSTPAPTSAQVFSTPQVTQLLPTKTEVKVDETKVIELAKRAGKSQNSIYYTKQEIKFSSTFSPDMSLSSFGLGQGQLESIDYSQPLSYETWITSNYSKTKVSQNDKVILEYVTTPDYGFSYVGGKYAVQVQYLDQKYSIAGLSDDGTVIPNPEIELLKYILTSKNAGNAQMVNENGQDLIVIESNDEFGFILTPLSENKLKTKFYLDKKTFTLVRIDQSFGDKLVLTNSNIKSQSIDNQLPTEVFNTNDLKEKVEVKTVSYDPDQDLQKVINSQSVKDFAQNYSVLYLTGKQNSDIKVLDYKSTDYQKLQSYEKLIQTTDFNPLYQKPDSVELPLANYSFPSINVEVNIFENEPDLTEKVKFDIVKTDASAEVDNKKIEGSTFVKTEIAQTTPTPSPSLAPQPKALGLVFQYNNKWYVFQTSLNSANTQLLFTADTKLTKLSLTDAEKVDSANNVSPKLNFKSVSLKDIDSKERFLAGDLKDSYKLEAYFVGMSTVKGQDSICEKYYEAGKVDNDLYLSCVIEKNDGYIIKYQQMKDKNSDQSNTKNLSLIVLNASKTDTEKLLQPIQESKTQIVITEKNGKSFIVMTNLSNEQAEKVLDGVELNKDFDILNSQINGN